MPYEIDETHDPSLESWVESANDPGTDFPIQNLPFCVYRVWKDARIGVRIGDRILDIGIAEKALPKRLEAFGKRFGAGDRDARSFPDEWLHSGLCNRFAGHASARDRISIRRGLSRMLSTKHDELRNVVKKHPDALININDLEDIGPVLQPVLPIDCRDYTDFYASVFHATNVGSMFRPGNALLPNYKHVPIAYHGRASTIVPSGTDIVRPCGQQAPAEEGGSPSFGPCKLLDYELEVGVVVGRGNEMGSPIPIGEAEDHILGLCLVNDWSARDLQKWEYQPLGPFLAKNFATTVSPYIVTMEALAPFRRPAFERPAGDPQPLAYLDSDHNRAHGGVDLTLEVYLASEEMRKRGMDPVRLSRGTFGDMYWTVAQMLTHHSSNGCAMHPGDLLASGTVSGPKRESRGCLLELTWDGDAFSDPPVLVPGTQRTAVKLPTGEERRFLGDGDEVILKGFCEREGFRRIGFGECRGVVRPARSL